MRWDGWVIRGWMSGGWEDLSFIRRRTWSLTVSIQTTFSTWICYHLSQPSHKSSLLLHVSKHRYQHFSHQPWVLLGWTVPSRICSPSSQMSGPYGLFYFWRWGGVLCQCCCLPAVAPWLSDPRAAPMSCLWMMLCCLRWAANHLVSPSSFLSLYSQHIPPVLWLQNHGFHPFGPHSPFLLSLPN